MADLPVDDTIDVNIANDTGDKKVTVTTDGSKERLDVSLGESLSFQLQAFTPVVVYDSTGVALTTAWTSLVDYSASGGKLDFIACATGTSNYKVRLTIDATEIFDIEMADLNAIGLTNAVNVNIWAETALKNFRYRPLISVDFNTSLKVEAAMTTGTGTLFYLINYRVEA